MRNWYFAFLACIFLPLAALAQGGGAPEQECFNALPVCQPVYSQANSYSGFGTTQELNTTNQGCLGSGEKNDVWYVINVSTSGTLAFSITPNTLTNDYDFAVWDITGGGCQTIYNGTPPIGCNFSPTSGATGLSNTITGPQWGAALNVTAGQTLILNVSNFSNSQSGYTLDFGPSTASILDTIPPKFASTFAKCGTASDSLEIIMSEPIKCSSLSADGSDFILSPAVPGVSIVSAAGNTCAGVNSATLKFRIKFSSVLPSGNYKLFAKTGTDGNTLLDNCGNSQKLNDSVSFTFNPQTPPVVIRVDTPACNSARVIFDRKVKCSTVALNGSDFTVTGPSPVQVVRAQRISCDTFGMTDTVIIFFNSSVELPGTYTLGFKIGTDGNGVTDTCGQVVVAPFDFYVSDAGVNVTATPPVLCYPGYSLLEATTAFAPAGTKFTCGTHQGPVVGTSGTYPVGNGTTITTGGPNYSPFRGNWWNARTQIIYSASDLQAAGLAGGPITAMSFNIAQKGSTAPYNGFTIKMTCTPLNDLTGGFVAGVPVVYGPVTYSTTPGVNTFTLPTPYDWDSTQNILVEICYSNTAFTNDDQLAVTNNAATANSVYHRYIDNGPAGCTLTTTGNGGVYSGRPNITFTQVKPPPPGYGWLWTPSQFLADSSSPTTLAYVPQTTEYTVRIKDTFQCFRRGRATVTVSVRNPGEGPNNDTALCIGGAAQLSVNGGVRYEWFPTTGLSCTDCPNPVANPAQTTTYYAAIFDQYGCSDTLDALVIVNPLPVVNAGMDTSIYYGSSTQLNLIAPGGRYILWSPAVGLNDITSVRPIASPLEPTVYTALVTDTNGCYASDTVRVDVIRTDNLFVPSAFSPNGDRNNDIFRVSNLTFQKLIEMRVFDRWGNLVCNTTDNTKGWDGTYKGEPAPTGVYQYIIRVASPDGILKLYKGDVTLVR